MTQPPPNDVQLTWALLLAHWTEFARSSVALPEDGEAGRHRRSVASLITLAALTHALNDLDRLADDERALAIDKAEIQIRGEIATLDTIWEGEDPPEAVWVFVEEAAAALGEAQGVEPDADADEIDRVAWFAAEQGIDWGHPGELLTRLAALSPTLAVWVPSPGVPFFDGAVVVHAEDSAGVPDKAIALISAFLGDGVDGPAEVAERYQVFRQFDFLKGGPTQDLLAPEILHDTVPGQPLLVQGVIPNPGASAAEIAAVPMPPRKSPPIEPLPVYEAIAEEPAEVPPEVPGDAEDDAEENNDA